MSVALKTTRKKATARNSRQDYNALKEFGGQVYTGMQVGRSHKWNYDKGVWQERKATPDQWDLTYSVIKRRAGKAPEGSGVPVGTGYHWFILSHQFVHKLNANDYSTAMTGIKFKIAHKRADKDKWNLSEAAKRKLLIKMLKAFITSLESEPEKTEVIPLDFVFQSKKYEGRAVPLLTTCADGVCRDLDITLNDQHYGIIRCTKNGWRMTDVKPQKLVNTIGAQISLWYE
ncbi:hypothetical protein [Niabella sp.]|uniref:hypothetical protein n=1 Tax=Niabella sp. TaxID=1962976 RepID=UPI002637A722|nr:hypothetical protein [Niabella sp.]